MYYELINKFIHRRVKQPSTQAELLELIKLKGSIKINSISSSQLNRVLNKLLKKNEIQVMKLRVNHPKKFPTNYYFINQNLTKIK